MPMKIGILGLILSEKYPPIGPTVAWMIPTGSSTMPDCKAV